MFDVGVYAVSMVNWLTQKRVERVFGGTANYFFQEHRNCGLEDFGALVLTLETESPQQLLVDATVGRATHKAAFGRYISSVQREL